MNAGCMIMGRRKWSMKEQAELLKKTGELLSRGYPLAEAIHSLTYQLGKHRKEEITEALAHLKEGHPFHKVLIDLGFNETLIGFVYFAEQHGSLADAFQDGSEMMLKRGEDLQKLKKIVIYPLFLVFITFFLFIFVEKILLPKYLSLFFTMNLPPNVFMKIIHAVGNVLPLFLTLASLIILTAVCIYFIKFRKLPQLKQKTILTSLPLAGSFYRLLNTYYFSIQLSYLLGGGLSILEALKLFEAHVKDSFDRELGSALQRRLVRGERLEDILQEYSFFEKKLAVIVKHGQNNGKLDQELFFFSKHCLLTLGEKTEKMLKTVQPILYVMIGLVIVSLYLAILLPMFQLLDGF